MQRDIIKISKRKKAVFHNSRDWGWYNSTTDGIKIALHNLFERHCLEVLVLSLSATDIDA